MTFGSPTGFKVRGGVPFESLRAPVGAQMAGKKSEIVPRDRKNLFAEINIDDQDSDDEEMERFDINMD